MVLSHFSKKQFVLLGVLFHVLAAVFSYGAHHPDELFQVFEFAGYKLGLNQASELPWEFNARMRSSIQPLVVYGLTKLCYLIQVHNPFLIALFLRILVSAFSFYAVYLLIQFFENEISDSGLKINLWFLGTLLWCLPYFHARFSSENLSASLFIFGFLFCLKQVNKPSYSVMSLIMAGFLMVLAFLCRFQISFMIIGFLAWLVLIKKTPLLQLAIISVGALLALGCGLLLDFWMYGEWTLSWWNYLDLNVFKHAAAQFGEQPFYFYVTETILQLLFPFSLLALFLCVVFWIQFKTHVLSWISVPFIFLHFFVGHKELRFLFPMLDFLPLMWILAISYLQLNSPRLLAFLKQKLVIGLFLVMNLIALMAFTLMPADNVSQVLKTFYDLSDNQKALIIYQDNNPYNNSGSLHYFKNPNMTSIKVDQLNDSLLSQNNVYYFSENFRVSEHIKIKQTNFRKVYSKFPWWFVYFNYNNWLDRAGFYIYKKE